MQRVKLGARGPEVSRLCFGTLTMGPLQRDMAPEAGAELICYAASQGIDFLDTAEIYGTYAHIALALRQYPALRISTKSYAHDRDSAARSLSNAQEALGREYIDIFMLHEQESVHTLRGHEAALRYLVEQKQAGAIGAVGISTHHVEAVHAAVGFGKAYGGLDVVHPILNREGLGIVDGTRTEMEAACLAAKAQGIGIFAMKPLGGGHLISAPQAAFAYMLCSPCVDAFAVGMQCRAEIDFNLSTCRGVSPDAAARAGCDQIPRRLIVQDWCAGCGHCAERCDQRAITVSEGKATVNQSCCVRCGYCATVCPQFCLKVI